MEVRVDRFGRFVIPKPLRDAFGIGPATMLEVSSDGTGIRLEPVGRAERRVGEQDGLPILGAVEGALLTDDDVRRIRDELRR